MSAEAANWALTESSVLDTRDWGHSRRILHKPSDFQTWVTLVPPHYTPDLSLCHWPVVVSAPAAVSAWGPAVLDAADTAQPWTLEHKTEILYIWHTESQSQSIVQWKRLEMLNYTKIHLQQSWVLCIRYTEMPFQHWWKSPYFAEILQKHLFRITCTNELHTFKISKQSPF